MAYGNDLNYIVLNFDLDTKKLKEYYSKSRRNAYREIQQFLESNGFEHRQWSGYISMERMEMQEVYHLLKLFGRTHPWMEYCANRFDVSEVKDKDKTSFLDCFSSQEEEKEDITKKKGPKLSLDGASGSLMDQFNRASAVAERSNAKIATKTKEEMGRE